MMSHVDLHVLAALIITSYYYIIWEKAPITTLVIMTLTMQSYSSDCETSHSSDAVKLAIIIAS